MILGIGTDICDIRRIETLIEKYGERFTQKTFRKVERDYCESKARPAMSYAKRFAAKEATAKALAGSQTGSLSWKDVWVENDPSGRPQLYLRGGAQARFDEILEQGARGMLHLSLSDDYPYATAFVIAETYAAVGQA